MTGIQLLYPTDWLNMLFRISLSLFVGGVIGWEREITQKPAGLRTQMLVSLGAALFVMISIQTGMVQQSADSLSRIMQGIVTGVGFLGAGEIFSVSHHDSGEVRIRGLTTAASIWVSTALGVAAGCGLWEMCLIGVGVTLIVLRGVKKLEDRMMKNRQR